MSIGKSKAKVYVEKDTKVTFADVAGVDEAKDELQEIVNFLKDPERLRPARRAARRRACCWSGRPAPARRCWRAPSPARRACRSSRSPARNSSRCSSASAPPGCATSSSRRARRRRHHLHRRARRARPRPRRLPGGGGHDEKEQTLNQLLAELDGFDPREGLVLLAATNRPEILDPALLRAGRFDRQVLVDRPDKNGPGRDPHGALSKAKLAADVDPEQVAALTPGFTGADLANLVNEAALLATRRGADAVAMADFTAAIERIVAGLEKTQPAAQSARSADRRLSRDGPCAGRRCRCRAPIRCTRFRSSRAASARSATRSSGRPRIAI